VADLMKYFDYPAGRVNYLTHISRRHNAVFIEVPKAGCTVVKRAMQFSEHGGEPHQEPESVHERSTSPLGAPLRDRFDLDEVFGEAGRYFRFAFVRNPYSRALSCYLEKIAGEQWLREMRLPKLGFKPDDEVEFVEFLRRVAEQDPADMDIHWAPQEHLLSLGKVRYGFLGRFESFRQDLLSVIGHLGMTVPDDLLQRTTPHTTNAREKILQYYDDESTALVQRIYRLDFETLGYGLDPRFAG
jgi:hypothetical protein